MPERKDWATEGTEIRGDEIGKGFVRWSQKGESIRGRLIRTWQTGAMETPAVVLELTEEPKVAVEDSTGDGAAKALKPKPGDLVNMSLGYDLGSKLAEYPKGLEVGIVYVADVPTKTHTMRRFKVYNFSQEKLPF